MTEVESAIVTGGQSGEQTALSVDPPEGGLAAASRAAASRAASSPAAGGLDAETYPGIDERSESTQQREPEPEPYGFPQEIPFSEHTDPHTDAGESSPEIRIPEVRENLAEPEMTQADAQPAPDAAPAPATFKSLKSLIAAELASLERYHRQVLDSGEPEAIHKMRVITRKLQAAIDLLEFSPDQLKIRSLKKRLRRWRRSLSRVRNYDVFLKIIEKESLARRPGGRRPYELIGTELEKRRVKNLRKARSELQDIKISDLASRLGFERESREPLSSVEAPALGEGARTDGTLATVPLIEDTSKIAARAFDRLRQRLAEFQARALSTHAADHPAEIHELRIAAKRLRYLIEALSQMGYGESARAVEWLKATQDRLGDLHDLEAFGDEVVRIAAKRKFVRRHMAEAGEMLQAASRFLAKRESLRARFLPVRVPAVLGTASSRLTKSVSAASVPREHE
ncbi:MAG TPA: CHAD domain-containing protein [Blastocatellia bacterium]|nr:CHAD domain-containing protein [Blastocatellia bacterium]